MQSLYKALKIALPLAGMITFLVGCSSLGGGMQIAGNKGGSQPLNEHEVNTYKRAILKCYKTGGVRVVKIDGKLRCFN